MRSSSASPSHSTQVPIKVRHRQAKKRQIRRRRVDLRCGCSYFVSINCANHGFTHRGTHHCSSSREWRLYLGGPKSSALQSDRASHEYSGVAIQHNQASSAVQPQPPESIRTPQVLDNLDDINAIDPLYQSDWDFLEGL
uniref:Transcriptional activator protein n=1 Tax=Soybean chlorotic blotch virus TaxID=761702 RepID=A0A191KW24_9GEMI|nr:AC2 [Soybean chlorotic blotch virus]